MPIIAVVAAVVAWFVLAGALFFNPIVDKIYRKDDGKPGVRSLPPNPKSIAMILCAILVQVVAWAIVYAMIKSALPDAPLYRGLLFGLILVLTKMMPRDADRLLLSTYPLRRMLIEFVIGCVSVMCVGVVFGYLL